MTTWDVAVVVSHRQLHQAMLKIRRWRLVGNRSFSQFTDGNLPLFPEHWVATCDLPFPVDLRHHIINTKTTAGISNNRKVDHRSALLISYVMCVLLVVQVRCNAIPRGLLLRPDFLDVFFSRVGTGVVEHVHMRGPA